MTGNELKDFRASLGMNQEQFGKLLGVSRITISSYETGDVPIPYMLELACKEIKRQRS